MSFGNIPQYIIASLPAPILDVNASGLLDVTSFNSINITGPYNVQIKTSSLFVGTRFFILNSSNTSQCVITLDSAGYIGLPGWRSWSINPFPLEAGAVQTFKFDGTNLVSF
jgi:hypothetical protein